MTISGFTFLRNANKLYYPVQESIKSILELVDEFVIAIGKGDDDDKTVEMIRSIGSDKIKLIYTEWDLTTYHSGTIYAQQTDIAKQACSGDWLFYLQGDEVIHENDLNEIKTACKRYKDEPKVEGFVFNYLHFYGDYEHYFSDHTWYKKEIRIIRNKPEIHSWRDAQSFRVFSSFNGNDYLKSKGTRKLQCVALKARVFHYGWVRPPHLMQAKNKTANKIYTTKENEDELNYFDYGRMDYCKIFMETHPSVMKAKIQELNWKHLLRFSGPTAIGRALSKHEKTKYRILSFIEEKLLGGRVIGGFKNYKLLF